MIAIVISITAMSFTSVARATTYYIRTDLVNGKRSSSFNKA